MNRFWGVVCVLVVLAAFDAVACGGVLTRSVFVEVPFYLLTGWVFYLARTLPQVGVSWPGVATAAALLLGVTAGLHWFGGWWVTHAPAADGAPAAVWPLRRTTGLVALVVLLFAAGLCGVGAAHQTGWLLTSKEPLTRDDFSGRNMSKNNLKQIGISLENYRDVHHAVPPGGTFDDDGRPLQSWMTRIVPYTEAGPLYKSIDQDKSWNHSANAGAFHTELPCYLIPHVEPTHVGDDPLAPGAAHYAANSHLFGAADANAIKGMRLEDMTDGIAHTIAVGEAAGNYRAWGDPANLRDPTLGVNATPDGFGGPWKGGACFVMTDGSVQFLSNDVDPAVLRALATPAAGDVASGEF